MLAGSLLTVDSTIFEESSANMGGAIAVIKGGALSITGSVFNNCSALSGIWGVENPGCGGKLVLHLLLIHKFIHH